MGFWLIFLFFSICSSYIINVILLCLLFSVKSASDAAQRSSPHCTNTDDPGSFKTKDNCANPDKSKATRKKSSDSGEEADKDFILIWATHQVSGSFI